MSEVEPRRLKGAADGECEKTEWVIASPKFGKRRVWIDNVGFFYVVHNMAYRHYDGDDLEVYKAERVIDVHDDNVRLSEGSAK